MSAQQKHLVQCSSGRTLPAFKQSRQAEYDRLTALSGVVTVQTELTTMLSKEEFASTWQDALDASIRSQEMELGFIDEAEFLRPVRHLDMRRSVQIDYLKARLAYLTLLKSEADQSYGPFY
jgi:hypothetical protein